MSSRCRKLLPAALLSVLLPLSPGAASDDCCGDSIRPQNPPPPAAPERPAGERVLRITADPNNLPFSNDRLEGFENKIAELLARELGMRIEWSWRAQRRGFFRETLKENTADLVLGAPSHYERALTTAPYYRSAYAFVSRKDQELGITSLDDPRLRELKVGVQIIGDDATNSPPAHALALRGIVHNIRGYSVLGDYSQPNPPARIIDAVANGEVDVAIAWGPLAGYFAKQSAVPLEVTPVSPQADSPALPFAFDISLGVRKRNQELQQKLDEILVRKRADIERILDDYGVPRVARPQPPAVGKAESTKPE